MNLLNPLQWRHNGRDSVSNHQPHDCLLNRLYRHRSKKSSKRRVTGLCAGNSTGTGEFPAQMASSAENVSIWWRHHNAETQWLINVPVICVITSLGIGLSPGRCQPYFIGPWEILMWFYKCNFQSCLLISIFKSSYDNVLRWMPHDLTDDKSTLVQVMAWCRQATSHYLTQCWPRSPTPYGVTRPQWVNEWCWKISDDNAI